jgi:hypothetical protein
MNEEKYRILQVLSEENVELYRAQIKHGFLFFSWWDDITIERFNSFQEAYRYITLHIKRKRSNRIVAKYDKNMHELGSKSL